MPTRHPPSLARRIPGTEGRRLLGVAVVAEIAVALGIFHEVEHHAHQLAVHLKKEVMRLTGVESMRTRPAMDLAFASTSFIRREPTSSEGLGGNGPEAKI